MSDDRPDEQVICSKCDGPLPVFRYVTETEMLCAKCAPGPDCIPAVEIPHE